MSGDDRKGIVREDGEKRDCQGCQGTTAERPEGDIRRRRDVRETTDRGCKEKTDRGCKETTDRGCKETTDRGCKGDDRQGM